MTFAELRRGAKFVFYSDEEMDAIEKAAYGDVKRMTEFVYQKNARKF